ncbi:MAG: M28 family peptidase, partial [Acidobacteriaceae bacterium]|nr:M28 family peptidase [Acidobacteriaceae bacterium]
MNHAFISISYVSLRLIRVFLCFACALTAWRGVAMDSSGAFQGAAALSYARRVSAFGERPSGSAAIDSLREWIVSELKPLGGQLLQDRFAGQTPTGPVPMDNLILKFPGTSGKAIVISGHYDTKHIPMMHFVGANDGASSTAFLIELAHAIAKQKHRDDIYIVFFDGEEAVGNWTQTDSRYGS